MDQIYEDKGQKNALCFSSFNARVIQIERKDAAIGLLYFHEA